MRLRSRCEAELATCIGPSTSTGKLSIPCSAPIAASHPRAAVVGQTDKVDRAGKMIKASVCQIPTDCGDHPDRSDLLDASLIALAAVVA